MALSLSSSRCVHHMAQRCTRHQGGRVAVPAPVLLPLQPVNPAPICERSPSFHQSRQAVVTHATAPKTVTAPSTIKIIIQGRKLEVTDAIKAYVESKISHCLSHFNQEVKEVDVTLSARGGDTGTHGKKQQKVDVTLYTVRNGVVRVEDTEETLYAAIDLVSDKLSRKMGKVKERAIAKGKWPGRAGPKEPQLEEAEFNQYMQEVAYETAVFDREEALKRQFAELNKEFPAAVRRTKVIDLDPISVDEAIEAMEAVGHDFFVFRELESDQIQVVYRRQSEGYGVLIPKKRE